MVDVENLTKSFGDLEVLRGINMHIDRGEVVSIVGASGAGKTTLLQIIGTLDRPTSGTVRIGGTDTSTLGEDALARFRNPHTGLVLQFHQLPPAFPAGAEPLHRGHGGGGQFFISGLGGRLFAGRGGRFGQKVCERR